MTIFITDAAIARIGTSLLNGSLPKSEWSHAAHFAATVFLARHHPAQLEPAAIGMIIRAYNDATATPNTDMAGYHATITLASVRAVRAVMAQFAPEAPLHLILADLLASPCGRSDWLLAHWRRETLFSVAARRGWVDPDRAPLPF